MSAPIGHAHPRIHLPSTPAPPVIGAAQPFEWPRGRRGGGGGEPPSAPQLPPGRAGVDRFQLIFEKSSARSAGGGAGLPCLHGLNEKPLGDGWRPPALPRRQKSNRFNGNWNISNQSETPIKPGANCLIISQFRPESEAE